MVARRCTTANAPWPRARTGRRRRAVLGVLSGGGRGSGSARSAPRRRRARSPDPGPSRRGGRGRPVRPTSSRALHPARPAGAGMSRPCRSSGSPALTNVVIAAIAASAPRSAEAGSQSGAPSNRACRARGGRRARARGSVPCSRRSSARTASVALDEHRQLAADHRREVDAVRVRERPKLGVERAHRRLEPDPALEPLGCLRSVVVVDDPGDGAGRRDQARERARCVVGPGRCLEVRPAPTPTAAAPLAGLPGGAPAPSGSTAARY